MGELLQLIFTCIPMCLECFLPLFVTPYSVSSQVLFLARVLPSYNIALCCLLLPPPPPPPRHGHAFGSSAHFLSAILPSVMKLCLPICVHVAVSLTICICPGLRASVHAMMLCACVVCLVFIFVCRLFTVTSDACACACGLRAYHYLLAALLIIT